MIAIGIRVSPKQIYYTVLEETGSGELKYHNDKVVIPVALDLPKQLASIRTTFISIMTEFKVERAGIRLTESNARSLNIFRLNTEGVLQELIANCSVEKYFAGQIATIGSLLSLPRKEISGFFEGTTCPMEGMDNWSKFGKEQRESYVTALAALHVE